MSRIPVKIQKRGSYYYLRYWYQGREIKESTKTADLDKAQRICSVLEARLNSEEVERFNADMFFCDLASEYLDNYAKLYLEQRTHKDYSGKIETILPYLGSKPIKVINDLYVENFMKQLKHDRDLKKSSVNRYLAVLSGIFSYAVKKRYLRDNPCKGVQRFREADNSKDFDYYSDREIVQIIESSKGQFKAFVMTAIYAGLRRGELIGLQWPDVDFTNNHITVARSYDNTTKSKKVRIVGLHPELKEELICHKSQTNGNVHVFPGKHGGMLNDFRKQWKSTLQLAGVRYLNFHVLRHTFSTKFLKSGNTEAELREILGHRSFQTTKRYTHLANESEHMKSAINRISF